jgi:hypothetical protein
MTYQLYLDNQGNEVDGICRHNDDGSTSYIPNCADNQDWINYQAWLALGNTPEAA